MGLWNTGIGCVGASKISKESELTGESGDGGLGASMREPVDTLNTEIEPFEVTLSKISLVLVLSLLVAFLELPGTNLGIEEVSGTVWEG